MQGWIELQEDSIEKDIHELAQRFLKISPVIDHILELYKR